MLRSRFPFLLRSSTFSCQPLPIFTVPESLRFAHTVADYLSVSLNNLQDNPGARKKKWVRGRGPSAGRGKTGGHGHKGDRSRTGGGTSPGFEGGQSPIFRRIRKYGFTNIFSRQYIPINLGQLQLWIDTGRIDPSKKITMKTLFDAGMINSKAFNKQNWGVKLLGIGRNWFQSNIDLEVSQVSKLAKEAVERKGGKVVTVYFNKLGLRTFLKKEPKDITIKFAIAPLKIKSRFDIPKYELNV